MIGALVYKDYRLLTNHQWLSLIAQHLFLTITLSLNLGLVGYGVAILSGAWAFLMGTLQKDQLNFGRKLLYVASYTKEQMVLARYIGTLFYFLILNVLYLIVYQCSRIVGLEEYYPMVTKEAFLFVLALYLIFTAITMPLYYYFAQTTIQMISAGIIMIPPFIGVGIANEIGMEKVNQVLEFWQQSGIIIACIFAIVLSIVSERFCVYLEKRQEE